MYNSFYGFADDPFRAVPDQRYAYAHHSYRAAKQLLTRSVSQGAGIILVTGGAGTGKTTLLGDFLSGYPSEKLFALHLGASPADPDFLFNGLSAAAGINPAGADSDTQLRQIETFLKEQRDTGRRALVVIDEAHTMVYASLEQLHACSAWQYDGAALVQFILLGEETLPDIMKCLEPRTARGEGGTTVKLEPILIGETRALVEYRLKLAWWEDDPNISTNAYELIHRYALGVPGKIVLICKKLIQYGEHENQHTLDANDVRIVISQLISELASQSAIQPHPRHETSVSTDPLPQPREQGPGTPKRSTKPAVAHKAKALLDGFGDDPVVKKSLPDAQPALLPPAAPFKKLELLLETATEKNAAATATQATRATRYGDDLFGYVHALPQESSERMREKLRVATMKRRVKTAAFILLLLGGAVAGAAYFLNPDLNQYIPELAEARQQEAHPPSGEANKVVIREDQAAREETAQEQAAREQAAREQAAREQAAREQAAREQAAREQAAREQAAREQAAREQAAREQAAREQAAREQPAREQPAREQAAREQAAREQAAREQAAREQAARPKAVREAAIDIAVLSHKLTTHNSARWISQKNVYGFYVGNVLNAEYSQDQGILTVTADKKGAELRCVFSVSKAQGVSAPCSELLSELSKYVSH